MSLTHKEINQYTIRVIYLYQAKYALEQMRFRLRYADEYTPEFDDDVIKMMDRLENLRDYFSKKLRDDIESGE